MPAPPRPCSHCGNPHLVFIPNVLVDIAKGATVLGMRAVHALNNVYWSVTLVVCNQCGCTQMFTSNAAELVATFGGNTQTVPQR